MTFQIPDSLYSPIVYQILTEERGKNSLMNTKFLLARITVVNSEDGKEIKKNNKVIMNGVLEFALTRTQMDEKFRGKTKIQFTSSSYHHNRKKFCWEIKFYTSSDLNNPILIKRSNPFTVYARKPYTNRSTKRKRQVENINRTIHLNQVIQNTEQSIQTNWNNTFVKQGQSDGITFNETRPCKILRKEENEDVLQQFTKKLEELLNFNKKLAGNQKQFAMDYAIKSIMKLDPTFTPVLMLSNLQQMFIQREIK